MFSLVGPENPLGNVSNLIVLNLVGLVLARY